ncbi:MAG: LamG-like jellyroll fold domain-containing protein [Patescibacteria group bacterium]|nr:LamG-like jellyroll fold domain-containing protein [Patescibacteria group bacterium]
MTTKKEKSFTLIELLVVIATIGLLASIIYVSLSGAREQARIANSLSFEAQIYHLVGIDATGIWNFNEGVGSTTVIDMSGNDNDGTISGATYKCTGADTPNNEGCSLEFDGTNHHYVSIPNTEKFPLFSLSIWVYNEQGGDGRHSMLRDFWEIVGDRVCFWSYDFANDYWRCSNVGSVPYNKWTHIVTVWDGSVISHYINGRLDWKDTNTSSGTSQSFYRIAGYSTRRFMGSLDNLRIYKQALPSAQIQKLYAEGLERHNLLTNK